MQVFDVETAVRKLSSRFRRSPQVSRPEWPVISATRPLFYVARLFGVAPFKIFDGHFALWSSGLIYSLFCAIVHTYVLYCVLHRFMVARRQRAVLDITETAKVSLNYCVAMLNIIIAFWTRKEFNGVLSILRKFDMRARDLGIPRKEVAAKIWVWFICICSTCLWTAVNSTGMVAFLESWFDNMAYLVNYVATSLSIIKFSGVVLLLGQRFRQLNEVALRSKECAMTEQKHIAVDLKVILQLHNSLMVAGESLSSQYSWPLLLWLSNLCCHSVSNLYFLIHRLIVTPIWVETRLSLVYCIICCFLTFVAQLLLLHIFCNFASSEANSMASILVNWKSMTIGRNHPVGTLLHLINRRLNFSAAGCFYVNLPLLRFITGLLTTYLVLLLQFQALVRLIGSNISPSDVYANYLKFKISGD